jgi:hypothetical protein
MTSRQDCTGNVELFDDDDNDDDDDDDDDDNNTIQYNTIQYWSIAEQFFTLYYTNKMKHEQVSAYIQISKFL